MKNTVLLGAVALSAFCASALGSPDVTLTDANTKANPITYTACTMAGQSNCDDTLLTIAVSSPTTQTMRVVVHIEWPTPTQTDFDLKVTQDGAAVADSATVTNPEVARFDPINGDYNIHISTTLSLGNSVTTTIYLEPLSTSVTKPGPVAGFQIFVPPDNAGAIGGEPSIGANWKTGTAVVGNGGAASFLDTLFRKALFVTFDDSAKPATATWVERSPKTNLITVDPILYTDRESGRTVESQLIADFVEGTTGCSLSSVSTDDGLTWIPSEGCGPPAGADHQSIGGGPYHAPLAPLPPVSANAIYYCAQALGPGRFGNTNATCSRSDDGGLTYGPGIVVYAAGCIGLHGHPRVAPDGTVYLPNGRCVGNDDLHQVVWVSKDNGLSWAMGVVPDSTPRAVIADPSVATGLNDIGKPAGQPSNTVYFGYCDGDGRAKVAVSHTQGATWSDSANVGQAADIRNCAFPAVIAGDDNRASMFFLGAATPGNHELADFAGEWHAYIATTYDGGNSWGLYDATPGGPGADRLHLAARRRQSLPQPARLQRHHARQAGPSAVRVRRRLPAIERL